MAKAKIIKVRVAPGRSLQLGKSDDEDARADEGEVVEIEEEEAILLKEKGFVVDYNPPKAETVKSSGKRSETAKTGTKTAKTGTKTASTGKGGAAQTGAAKTGDGDGDGPGDGDGDAAGGDGAAPGQTKPAA